MGDNQINSVKKSQKATELSEFEETFPELVDDLTKEGLKNPQISVAVKWFKQVCEYNVPHGKKNRGLALVTSYQEFVPNASEENLKRAKVLGWCVEWLQAFFLVADDIMDQSLTRRGRTCWYKKDNVGNIAINDSFFLESAVYQLLKIHIRDQPYYTNVLELFHETTLQTVIGQCLDLTTAPTGGTVDFSSFTMERYSTIVKWKTAFYSFYLPVALAMHMAGLSNDKQLEQAKTILLAMGHFFQVQDDYLDCYGDPEVIGKIGTDIEDNKCSWLVVQALERANQHQRQILEENYGQWDPSKVAKVKSLYKELDLETVYKNYEESSYQELMQLINKFSGSLPKDVFISFSEKIYKRQK